MTPHVKDNWLVRYRGGRVFAIPTGERETVIRRMYLDWIRHLANHTCAHGFVRGRDRATAVWPHVAAKYIAHLDLVHFFDHCTKQKVGWGLNELHTIPADIKHCMEWCFFHDHLPTGARTSPALSNAAALHLDRLLCSGPYNYSRYVDNLIVSSIHPIDDGVIRSHVLRAGFTVNERKSWVKVRGRHRIRLLGIRM